MIPVLGGLGSALVFSVSVLVSARASRLIGSPSTVAGAMIVGLVIALPIALLTPAPPNIDGTTMMWLAMSGFGNIIGLLLIYTAYRLGAVGIVSTIASTEGAMAAVLSVAAGEILVPGAGILLAVIAAGVVLAASGGGEEEGIAISRDRALRAAGVSLCAALCFGVSLFGAGRAAGVLPIAWAILPARVVGVAFVAVPLLGLGRFQLTRPALPFVIATGICEVVGFWLFGLGAREGPAVASVLSSMFAPLAAIAAFAVFRERLSRRQIVGIALTALGVAALGIVQQ
jgi:drug/metabolite transporter (DMT)-like permease